MIDNLVEENQRLQAAVIRAREALLYLRTYFRRLEDGTDEDDPLRAIRRLYHAPLHAAIEEGLRK